MQGLLLLPWAPVISRCFLQPPCSAPVWLLCEQRGPWLGLGKPHWGVPGAHTAVSELDPSSAIHGCWEADGPRSLPRQGWYQMEGHHLWGWVVIETHPCCPSTTKPTPAPHHALAPLPALLGPGSTAWALGEAVRGPDPSRARGSASAFSHLFLLPVLGFSQIQDATLSAACPPAALPGKISSYRPPGAAARHGGKLMPAFGFSGSRSC